VLAAWSASPARFREDANAEEDLARGAYRDRVVIELAQNAADAAAAAGRPGRLRLTLRYDVLTAANVGAPLDAAGVQALSTLRASAKRSAGTVGRFGVGFAAVLALTDAPEVRSRTGSVAWSTARTAQLVAGIDALAPELARRAGTVPALRLPFPSTGAPPAGWDTEVVLPLRDAAARATAHQLLAATDAALLLALSALTAVEIDIDGIVRRLTAGRDGADLVIVDGRVDGAVPTRWRTAAAAGELPAALLADRPTEDRERAHWSVRWAVPVTAAGVPVPLPATTSAVVHAPTATDDPLTLPALLVATLPLDPGRRRVAPGPLLDWLLERAAEVYADLLPDLAADPAVLALVPIGLPAGEVDGRLRAAIGERLRVVPFLPAASPADMDLGLRLQSADAVALDLVSATGPAVEVLAEVLPGLLPEPWCRPARTAALAALGVRRMVTADVVAVVAGLHRPAEWWRGLYAALADAPDREALGALPVPLADGGTATGPRGLVAAGRDVPADALAVLGLRAVHPDAEHPLLLRLGTVAATPRAVLADPRVRAAVAASYDAEDPSPVADAVLALVAAAGVAAGEEPWLAELALRGADGEFYPAGELLLPNSPLVGVIDPTAPFGVVDEALVAAVGPDVLAAVGVLTTFAVLRATDVPVDPQAVAFDLDGEADWLADVDGRVPAGTGLAVVAELTAVRDLEWVAADRWDAVLRLLAAFPLRAQVSEPALVRLGSGGRLEVPSYTRWWLSRHPVLGGERPDALRLPDGDPALVGLYDVVHSELDEAFLRTLGCPATVADVLAEPAAALDLLDRLGDRKRSVDRRAVAGLHAQLAAVLGEPEPPPERVRAVLDGGAHAVPAGSAVVVEAPDLLPLVGGWAVVPAPASAAEAVARLLDVPLAGELAGYEVVSQGVVRVVPGVVAELLGAAAPGEYREHDPLEVLDAAGSRVQPTWRYLDDTVHVDRAAGAPALGRALAWAAGQWPQRHAVVAVLADPALGPLLAAEADLDG